PAWPEAQAVLDAHAETWGSDFPIRSEDVTALAEKIEVLAAEPAFVYATPRLVRAVLPRGRDRDRDARERIPLLVAFAYAIAAIPGPGAADLDSLTDLAEAIFIGGVNQDRYREITQQLRDSFARVAAAPTLARWAVDTVAMLLSNPAPSEEARIE